MNPPLRVLVADDEEPARDELCYLLDRIEGVKVVGEAADGVDALEVITRLAPDAAFLDIQMPGLTGLEAARRLTEGPVRPDLVFVTAYEQRAVEAFEVDAVDYLLKPVELARLEQAIARLRHRRAHHVPFEDRIDTLLRMNSEAKERRNQVAIRVGERFVLVKAGEIIYASLVEESITIVTGEVSGVSSFRSLDELQATLDPDVFWRVHRSHLVNINQIKEIVPWFRNCILRMKDTKATEIPVSRAQTRRLREYLKL